MATNNAPTLSQIWDSLPTFRVKSLDDLKIREGYIMYEHITNRTTKGGLIMPNSSKPLSSYGIVLKVNAVKDVEVGDVLIIHDARQSIRVIIENEPDRWVMVSREDNHLLWTKPDNFLGHE